VLWLSDPGRASATVDPSRGSGGGGATSSNRYSGFRQFLLLGLDNVRGEWNLVTVAWNMKRMFVLAGAN
jgi:hypothetical protein